MTDKSLPKPELITHVPNFREVNKDEASIADSDRGYKENFVRKTDEQITNLEEYQNSIDESKLFPKELSNELTDFQLEKAKLRLNENELKESNLGSRKEDPYAKIHETLTRGALDAIMSGADVSLSTAELNAKYPSANVPEVPELPEVVKPEPYIPDELDTPMPRKEIKKMLDQIDQEDQTK